MPHEGDADPHRDGAPPHQAPPDLQHPPALDRRIAERAEREWGVLSSDELRELGCGRGALRLRVAQKRLVREHRGAFRVGAAPLRFEGHVLAAVKAVVGSSAARRSAAALHELEEQGRWDPVHVLVAGRGRRSRDPIRVHSQARIPPQDLTVVRGVPVTTWPRTVLDLGEERDARAVERLLDQAVVQRLYDEDELLAVVRRNPGRVGGAVLLDVLGRHLAGSTRTDSDLEELLLALCRDEALPRPLCQLEIGPWRADAAWPEFGVVVELDSARFHASADRRRRDQRKEADLRRRGNVVLRFDWTALTVGAKAAAHDVRCALRDGGWAGG